MTVFTVNGDLLKSNCTILIHQANCQNVMRSGIAKSLVEMYPNLIKTDRSFLPPPRTKERLGKYSIHYEKNSNITIYNLYGQYRYGNGLQTDYIAFETALESIFLKISDSLLEIFAKFNYIPSFKIGMPYGIACARAGGDWNIVSNIIEKLSVKYNLDIYLYKLNYIPSNKKYY